MRHHRLLPAALVAGAWACTTGIPDSTPAGTPPPMWPDYAGVTVPVNLAPIRFGVTEDTPARDMTAVFSCGGHQVVVGQSRGRIAISPDDWRRLTDHGDTVSIELHVLGPDAWVCYDPVELYVSRDSIDPYMVYRLIEPGYESWGRMGIYQRCLESYEQTPIVTNDLTGYGCVNCHSFCDHDPRRMLMHMRAAGAGTYITDNGDIQRLDTRTPQTISALVYPQWHPDGRYVAFSTNDTHQLFHTVDANRIEVYDNASDVVVYDTRQRRLHTAPQLMSTSAFQTFPTFSPDGRSLYYCTADSVAMPQGYRDLRYSLCRIDFDPATATFGATVDTIYNATVRGGSVSLPRVSPDGRRLMFTLSDYGTFSIWHREADLYMADLRDGTVEPVTPLNSPEAESYHSWSSNGRWVVFSSRRLDGLYTRPYIAHVDADGTVGRPLLLPQDAAGYYQTLMQSFNIPEFVSGRVEVTPRQMSVATGSEPLPVGF